MMSSGYAPSNSYAGVKNNNTKIFNLSSFGDSGLITGIRVYWVNHIVGLEFAFNGQSTGVIKGFASGSPFEDKIDLFQGDYIVEVFGRASHEITCFGFRTAKGFNRVWGNPIEGESFRFGQNGCYVKSLIIGATENITYLEPIYGDACFLNAKPLNFSNNGKFTQQLGKLFKDTEGFDDWDWLSSKFNYNIAEIKIWHNDHLVHGIQFQYHMDGTKKTPGKHISESNGLKCEQLVFNEGEHITKVLIKAGDMIDQVVFFTDQGRRVGGGGSGGHAYYAVAPQYHHFVAVGGGIGNGMHHLTLYYDEIF